jgi:small subunit ribosomal protein S18
MSDRAKIRARRVTGNDAQQQREVARAIKNAREMALLPYTNRVTTQRTSRERPDRGDRPDRPDRPDRSADGPPPRPQGPPPGPGAVDDLPTDALVLDAADDALDADVFVGAGDDEEG